MAGELIEKCQRLRINDAEADVLDTGVLGDASNDEKVSLLLVGRVVTDRNFHVEAFKRTITQAWGVSKRLVIRMIGPNRFVFQFFHWRDKEKVLAGRPWCFDNQLVVLNEITGNEQPSEVQLTHSPFWIRIKNLPFNCCTIPVCTAIAGKIGRVMDLEENPLHLDTYRRVRIDMDITKPLCRYQSIKGRDGRVVRVAIAYERLPFFCFLCGIIGHSERDCCNVDDDAQDKVMGWSKTLRATPRRGVQKMQEEVEEIVGCRKVLFVPKMCTQTVENRSTELVKGAFENADNEDGKERVEEPQEVGGVSEGESEKVGEEENTVVDLTVGGGLDGVTLGGDADTVEDVNDGVEARGPQIISPNHAEGGLDKIEGLFTVEAKKMQEGCSMGAVKGGGRKWRKLARLKVDKMEGVETDGGEGLKRSWEELDATGVSEVSSKKVCMSDEIEGWRLARSDMEQTRRAQ